VMQKYLTECIPFEDLLPGHLVGVPWGFKRLVRAKRQESGKWTLVFDGYVVTHHSSNWPDIATGFTPEYRKSYPGEKFERISVTNIS
jgi:hypothetical protein